jgi:hypothetical protein
MQGGAFFVATSYAFVYGRTPPRIYAYVEGKVHSFAPPTKGKSIEPMKGSIKGL